MINIMTKNNLAREGFISPYREKSGQEIKERTWKEGLKQKPRKNAAHYFVCSGLFSLLSYTAQDHRLRKGIPLPGDQALPYQSLIKKKSH